jgi:hypothetical protein
MCDDSAPGFITFFTTIEAIFIVMSLTISTKPIIHDKTMIRRNISMFQICTTSNLIIRNRTNCNEFIPFIRFVQPVIQSLLYRIRGSMHKPTDWLRPHQSLQWVESITSLYYQFKNHSLHLREEVR